MAAAAGAAQRAMRAGRSGSGLAAAAPARRLAAPPPRDVRAHFRWGARPARATLLESDKKTAQFLLQRFEEADSDNDGRIDSRELRQLLEAAWSADHHAHHSATSAAAPAPAPAAWLTDAEVQRLVRLYDFDGSGDLDRTEFERLVHDGLLPLAGKLADLRAAFEAADADGSGDVSADELRAALARCGRRVGDDELRSAMLKAGVNERGHLPFASFVALLRDERLSLPDLNDALAFVGARPPPPPPSTASGSDAAAAAAAATTSSNGARAVIHALASPELRLVTTVESLESALAAAGDEQLVVLMAGLTWCRRTRAMVPRLRELARGYGGAVRALLLFGNFSAESKALFRDALLVRSTPAVFLYRSGELLCHFAGGDARDVERQVRRRLPASASTPALPLFSAPGDDEEGSGSGSSGEDSPLSSLSLSYASDDWE